MNKLLLTLIAAGTFAMMGTAMAEERAGRDHKSGHDGGKRFMEHMMKADEDGDGKISLEEHIKRSTDHFEETDADGDGFLTADEMKDKMKSRRQKMKDKMEEIKDHKDRKADE